MLVGPAQLGLDHFISVLAALGKHPSLVPEIIPEREKSAGDELADLRFESHIFLQRKEDKVVE